LLKSLNSGKHKLSQCSLEPWEIGQEVTENKFVGVQSV
jgi:hypothetical protein